MKSRAAVAFGPGKPLEIVEIDVEPPRKGEVLIKITNTGVCHTDAFTLSGEDPEGVFPAVLGHEGAGIVEAVGPNVRDLKAGRRPDPKYGKIAKLRSTHNNYLTLPVIFLMLSNHYPLAFGTEFNWVIASLVFLMGVTIRHFFNTKHARRTWPWWTWGVTALLFAEICQQADLPPGVVNIVNGFGIEAGAPLAQHKRIRKVAFTGETTTGRLIMQYASENIIPVTLELGGKSPNVFFEDVMADDDAYWDKAQEGFTLFALNQGEVCTCPSRALVQESIAEKFLDAVVERTSRIVTGNPLDTDVMMGAQASNDQLEKITSYLDIGRQEGAEVLIGGARAEMEGELSGGYYVQPTIFRGDNSMRIFQEEIFGPVVSTTTFTDFDDAMRIANDTLYGLGAGVWSRNGNTAYRAGRAIQAGRVWVNNYHAYPAHAAFGGYKSSGIGRENHLMMLDHYQQTKNLLVSYSEDKLGFF